ncbi:MAG: nuclear transport factor 2 family protein [Leeuwenhoekiella sp.]
MKNLIICIFFVATATFGQSQKATIQIDETINAWHKAAAEADFETYFNLMSKDAVFIGTDATENWKYQQFKAFSKPYFDRGKAWSFTPVERNIFLNDLGEMAWFDELLNTQMGLCRGSGVLVFSEDGWKIKHYVLSIAIPNENVTEVTAMKSVFDKNLIQKLQQY